MTTSIRNKKWLFLGAFVLVIVVVVSVLFLCQSKGLSDKIYSHCLEADEVTIAALTDFEWDVAYIEHEPYTDGHQLIETYGIKGEFEPLDTDYVYRIAFCKGGALVYDLIQNKSVQISEQIKIIRPETVLTVTRKTGQDGGVFIYLDKP